MGKSFNKAVRSIGISATIFVVAFLAAFVSSFMGSPITDSNARTVATVVDNSGYYVSIESDDVSMSLISTPTGGTAIASDTILTKTNSPTGYKLYLSMANSETNGNRLYKDGDRASGMYISPSAGTLSTPVPLAVNTWGYTTAANADENSNFIGVPLQGNENLLQSTSAPNEQGVELGITYGAKANMALEAGIYSNEIAYTAIAEGEAAAEGTFSVFPTLSHNLGGGDTLTIATDLYTNMEDIGTITVTLSDGTSNYTCANPTKLNADVPGAVSISCTLPAVSAEGEYDITLTLAKFGKTYTKADAIEFEEIPLIEQCRTASTGGTFTFHNVEYIKLADGNCYTHQSQGTATWAEAPALCPAGTTLPTKGEFEGLVAEYGSGNGLNNATGWNMGVWTSTLDTNDGLPYRAAISWEGVTFAVPSDPSTTYNTLCIARTPSNITSMQQMTTNICSAMNVGDQKTLTDTRDTETYTIAKLADNKCWMTQNLRIVGPRTLTAENSNVTTDFPLTASDNSAWCTDSTQECIDQSMVLDSGNATFGAYYNWYAATAGSGRYETAFTTVSSSICPKGWGLPSNSAFTALKNSYATVSDLTATPYPAFVYSGDRVGNETVNQDSGAFYWGSTAPSGNTTAIRLSIGNNGQYAIASNAKYLGFSVRCLAQ